MTRTEAWFDGLYRQHHRSVFAYCLRRTGRADADDAVSEVFAVAWRRRQDVPGNDESLPWLYGVARNVLSHQWRSASRFRRLRHRLGQFPHPFTPGPETVVMEDQKIVHVRQALRRLRPGDQEVLRLSAWEGLDHREIAGILECTVVAVDKRLQRAKQRLKEQYESIRRTQDSPPATATGGGGGHEYD